MPLFKFGAKKTRRKLPPLLKCVFCERRPGEVYHHHLPLCTSCASTLQKRLKKDGEAVVAGIDALNSCESEQEYQQLAQKVIEHASRFVEYESRRIKTTDPEPTEIIRLVRAGETKGLTVTLWMS